MDAYSNLGVLLMNKGELDGAEAECLKAIEIDPQHMAAHSNLGVLLEKKGDLDGAEAEYLKAIEIDPRHVNAHQNFGPNHGGAFRPFDCGRTA
jgi:Tfp pilus assembly protein PilF